MDETLRSIAAQLPDYIIRIVGVVALFVIGRWLASWFGRSLRTNLEKRRFDPTLSRFFGTMAQTLGVVLVVLACLSIFGIATTSFAAVLGAAVFAIGLALQGSLSNFAAGVMLIIFRPYRVGSVVTIDGVLGTVAEIGLFTTALDTPANLRQFVPNTKVYAGTIENITFHDTRRADVAVGVDYSADIDATRAALEGALEEVPLRLPDGAHRVVLTGLGGSSVDWQVRVWCKTPDFLSCQEQTIRAVKRALDAVGIGIPFPQLDVHLDGGLVPARQAETGVIARPEM